jgi:hypothetical protein
MTSRGGGCPSGEVQVARGSQTGEDKGLEVVCSKAQQGVGGGGKLKWPRQPF